MRTSKSTYNFPELGSNPEQKSRFKTSAHWQQEEVSFNILNVCYPTLHTHEYYEILVVLSGSVTHKINNSLYVMHKGDCCLIRPDDCHCLEFLHNSESNADFLNVNFMCQPDLFRKITTAYSQNPIPTVLENNLPLSFTVSSSMVDKLKTACLHMQTPYNKPSSSDVDLCKAIICELIHACIRHRFMYLQNDRPGWLQELILALQNSDNFSKKMNELIEGIPYSYSYIQKQFKSYVGTSIIGYMNSIKMNHAKDLLTNTNLSVTEISAKLGFESVAHLNHLFKKSFGISPTSFRKQAKDNL